MITKNLLFISVGMIISVFIMTYFDQFGLDENYILNQIGMTTDAKIALGTGISLSILAVIVNFITNKRASQNKPSVNKR